MRDEIFVDVFWNMKGVEEFYNFPSKHKFTYWYHNMFPWNWWNVQTWNMIQKDNWNMIFLLEKSKTSRISRMERKFSISKHVSHELIRATFQLNTRNKINTIANGILSKLKETFQCCRFLKKRCDQIPLCCSFFQVIGFGEARCSKILSHFKTCLIVWLPCFVRHFLHAKTNSSWTLLQISKGGVSSFLRLCLNICTSCKTNVVKGWLFFGFENAFAFVLYFRTFPPFAIYTPFCTMED